MEKYKLGKVLGDGTFGTVTMAQNSETGQIVAIKKMKKKIYKWEECTKLQEIKALIKLSHPNIIQLLEIIKQNNELFFVFEYMSQNIYQLLKNAPLSEISIRNIIFQSLSGLSYMHQQGLFHRDLKPENILEFDNTIKLADFGLAKETNCKTVLTDYVSTRWYRAPEVILRSGLYGKPVDVFAMGTIMVELYNGCPIFPGESETDQINKILQVMGTPDRQEWPDGYKLAKQIGFQFPNYPRKFGKNCVPTANEQAIDLMEKMLAFNPMARPSALECLLHPYFQVPFPSSITQKVVVQEFKNKEENKFQIQNKINTSIYMKNARYKPGVQFLQQ